MERLLDEIDFELLKSIFSQIAMKCDIEPDKLNFLGRERVYESPMGGAYEPATNMISFARVDDVPRSSLYDRDKILKDTAEVYGGTELRQLTILTHEETHAVSRNVCIWHEYVDRKGESGEFTDFSQSGFHQILQGRHMTSLYGKEGGLFNALNEGTVEKLAREVALSYLQQAGWSVDQRRVFEESVAKNKSGLPYSVEVSLVNTLVEKLAVKNEQSEETTWHALVRALLNGERFEGEDIIELFTETFGAEFLKDLAWLYPTQYWNADLKILEFRKKYSV